MFKSTKKLLAIILVFVMVLCLTGFTLAPPSKTALLSDTAFVMDGKTVSFNNSAYTIDDSNYIQIRAVANILSGTKSQFNIYWDEDLRQAIIETDASYTGAKPINTEPAYGIGDPVTLPGVTITITNTMTVKSFKDGEKTITAKPDDIFYAVSFTVLAATTPPYADYWAPKDFISYISTDKGVPCYYFLQPGSSPIYQNKSTSLTIYFVLKRTDRIASVAVTNSEGLSKTVMVC